MSMMVTLKLSQWQEVCLPRAPIPVRPECKGPNSQLPPRDSSGSCSVCFLSSSFSTGAAAFRVVGWGKGGPRCTMYIFFKV